jgi:hypothetical protein
MTRLPVSLTSAGGRSNAISRVPKPSFATPMKGVTRMPYPHDEPPWTPQRTRALFHLFQTSAPPDFQRQLLERMAQYQHTHRRRRMGWWSLPAWWPGRVVAMVGCCGLVLGTCLTWWAVRTGPAAPSRPEVLVSRVVSTPPRVPSVPSETPRRGDQHGGFGSAEPLEPSVSAPQMQTRQSVDGSPASQTGDIPERTVFMPAPVQPLAVQKERQPAARRPTQRVGRSRGEPAKPSRSHTRLGTGQQAPG